MSRESKKRALVEEDTEQTNKKPKIHPFFTGKGSNVVDDSPISWQPSLGSGKSCLYGVRLGAKPSSKVAAFDLDGTLITGPFAHGRPRGDAEHWAWWRPEVAGKLKELHDEGYSVIIISNQSGLKNKKLTAWKKNVEALATKLGDIPFRVFAATEKDVFRKPMTGIWTEIERLFKEEQPDITIDYTLSHFVGDAAGRNGDFAATDRMWSLNIGIPFHTPEEYFLGKPQTEFALSGFNPTSIIEANLPQFLPSNTPLLPTKPTQEIVLFVGYPCLGKTSLYKKVFEPKGYMHINQDTLKTRDKCVKAVQAALEKSRSCVVDNTNRDKDTRKYYINLAKKAGVKIRCFHFQGTEELAWHNNLYRAFIAPPSDPPRELLPVIAFTTFSSGFEEPEVAEGFQEVKRVNWVFSGSEEERRKWCMWSLEYPRLKKRTK